MYRHIVRGLVALVALLYEPITPQQLLVLQGLVTFTSSLPRLHFICFSIARVRQRSRYTIQTCSLVLIRAPVDGLRTDNKDHGPR